MTKQSMLFLASLAVIVAFIPPVHAMYDEDKESRQCVAILSKQVKLKYRNIGNLKFTMDFYKRADVALILINVPKKSVETINAFLLDYKNIIKITFQEEAKKEKFLKKE